MIRGAVSTFFRYKNARRYQQLTIGQGSRVDFWKLHAKSRQLLAVGENSMVACNIVFERPAARLHVGSRTFVGTGLMSIAQSVDVGDDVLISWGATIVDHHSHSLARSQRAQDVGNWLQGKKVWDGVKIAPVRIESAAWLGFNVSVLCGVTVGEGAIVGACSLVTGDVPPWTIAAGNPARVIRELTSDERR